MHAYGWQERICLEQPCTLIGCRGLCRPRSEKAKRDKLALCHKGCPSSIHSTPVRTLTDEPLHYYSIEKVCERRRVFVARTTQGLRAKPIVSFRKDFRGRVGNAVL